MRLRTRSVSVEPRAVGHAIPEGSQEALCGLKPGRPGGFEKWHRGVNTVTCNVCFTKKGDLKTGRLKHARHYRPQPLDIVGARHFTKEQADWIKRRVERYGCTVSAAIRDAVEFARKFMEVQPMAGIERLSAENDRLENELSILRNGLADLALRIGIGAPPPKEPE